MKNKFCILPFMHLSTRTNGAMQLCCHANSGSAEDYRSIGHNRKNTGEFVYVDKDRPSEYWNTEYYKNIRKQFLEGKAPKECRACYKEEASGYRSKRQWENEEWSEKISFKDVLDRVKPDGTAPFDIKYIDMKFGNKCDLACLMCNPADSSKWIPDYNKLMDSDVSQDTKNEIHWRKGEGKLNWYKMDSVFWKDLEDKLDKVENLYIIGGEPTINSEFKSFLEMCVKTGHSERINLRFNTNGQTTANELKPLYRRFKTALIHLSMDGVGAYNDLIRYPSTWEDYLQKLDYWNTMPDNVKVTIDCTVSVLNVFHIPDLIKWKLQSPYKNINKFPENQGLIGLHFLHSPDVLSITVLPPELKQKVIKKYSEFFKWIEANTNVDLQKYKKLESLISFMNSKDNSKHWERTKEYLDKLDSIRQTSWKSVLLDYDKA
tara:strand:+ start:16538 stop:17833 length:1296 start_codon:yes stop_codon:yes gene_type:complete